MGANLSYPSVDLAGKVALVTGANTGIGYETAKALAAMGAHTIIACRSLEKATASVEQMKAELQRENADRQVTLDVLQLDLASFSSTRECVNAFKAKNLPLHLLINNAGVLSWGSQRTVTPDNHETMYQVNHLSPLLLTLELLPTLLETAAASGGDCRVVWVSSRAHEGAVWNPQNLDGEIFYNSTSFYRNSKLYNLMTAFNMQRRLPPNSGITVSALHPGVIKSDLWRTLFIARMAKPLMRSVKDGAATTINCAINPDLNSQQCVYYSDCAPKQPKLIARNEQYQEELWDISIKAIRDYLSPDALEQYGGSKQAGGGGSSEPTGQTPAAEDRPQQQAEEPSQS